MMCTNAYSRIQICNNFTVHFILNRYTPSKKKGDKKMHRSIKSKDVEKYPGDRKPREVKLNKEEDIEYESGLLKSSSGTTTVALTSKHLKNRKEAGSKTFAAKGSYRLRRIRCYTLTGKQKRPRGRRSTDDHAAVETTLSAIVDKREYASTY